MAEVTVPDPSELILDGPLLTTPTQVNRSQWTGKRKVVGLPGAETWSGSVTIGDIATETAEQPWRAFIFKMRGPVNWFRWALPCNTHSGSKPVVAAGAGDGYSLPLSGMAANATILKSGQFMTVPLPSGRHRAVCLTSDLVADGSGAATAVFEPALGEVPAAGSQVETIDPFIPMSFTETTQGLSYQGGVSGAVFKVEEAK